MTGVTCRKNTTQASPSLAIPTVIRCIDFFCSPSYTGEKAVTGASVDALKAGGGIL
jgi:hypothetical protein